MNPAPETTEPTPDRDSGTALADFFKALADPSRIRILGLVADGEKSVDEIAQHLSVKAPTVSHHLKRLREMSLVSVRADGNSRFYRLDLDGLDAIRQVILRDPALSRTVRAESTTATQPALPVDPRAIKVLESFIADGRLVSIPARRRKREVILDWLVQHFEHDREYAEAEVNEIIGAVHEDTNTLRRELVGSRRMTREKHVYTRTRPAVVLD